MRQVNIHEAKTHLSRLLDEVNKGDEIVIARAGKPVARLVGLNTERPRRQLGLLKDQIWVAEDFDAPLPDDLLDLFEGR
jgi:prevent-host-death family protein